MEYCGFIDMIGQGQLHQNAVDGRIVVEMADALQKHVLGHGFGQVLLQFMEAQGQCRFDLECDVADRGRVTPHQNGDQAGHHAVLGPHSGHIPAQILEHCFAHIRALDDFRCFH